MPLCDKIEIVFMHDSAPEAPDNGEADNLFGLPNPEQYG